MNKGKDLRSRDHQRKLKIKKLPKFLIKDDGRAYYTRSKRYRWREITKPCRRKKTRLFLKNINNFVSDGSDFKRCIGGAYYG